MKKFKTITAIAIFAFAFNISVQAQNSNSRQMNKRGQGNTNVQPIQNSGNYQTNSTVQYDKQDQNYNSYQGQRNFRKGEQMNGRGQYDNYNTRGNEEVYYQKDKVMERYHDRDYRKDHGFWRSRWDNYYDKRKCY